MRGTRPGGTASRRAASGAIVAALIALPLAACGGSGNSGGSTSCGTYEGLSSSDRFDVVKKMIDQHSGDDSTGAVDLAKLSVDAYCALHSSSDPISSVYNG
jgi:hypothetical protein